MTATDLYARAQAVLRLNDTGEFTKPSPRQYPHQWNWDSAFIALGLAHFDLPRALVEIRSLLRAQWRDGMVPHIIYPNGASDYFPPPDFWQTENLPHAGNVPSSGLTQPPILSTIVRMIYKNSEFGVRNSESRILISELRTPNSEFPQLLAWHRWLHTARDVDGTGLPCLIHPWESGMDNSPLWADALDRITLRDLPPFKRRDTIHVATDERPLATDYERFVHLIDLGRRLRWEPRALLDQMPFLVQDVLFCAILHRADEDLRALAIELGEDTREIDDWLARTRAVFNARFWDDARGLYLDYDVRAQSPIRVNANATFAPLFAGLASKEQAARLVAEHFDNPREYAPAADSKYRLPSVAKNERGYSPRRYWCGPVWIQMNWIIAHGLRRYGYHAQADALVRDSLALVAQSGFREYFDPRDGSGCGATDFSWSAALTLDMLSY
ncbi:MAG: trehalase family glycosidase [Anaerolineae bacterium]|nr:trehalase family glycosidase [Anaerolineae bacterium]